MTRGAGTRACSVPTLRDAAALLLFASSALAAQLPSPNLPLAFERQGARFLARGRGYGIALQDGRATLGIRGHEPVSLEFAGGAQRPGSPGPELSGKVNHLRGADPRLWQFGLPTYSRVAYRDVYPGIDVAWYGDQRQLEFDLVLHPGADPSRIRLKFRGADRISLGPDGVLLAGGFRLPLPAIYQESAGSRKTIQGRYVLLPNREVAFHLSRYDRAKTLVIDPTIVYAGLLGGGTDDTYGFGIAVDPDGNAYIAGGTYASDFPTANAAFPLWSGDQDGFVTKINSTGTAIVYSTFIGGSATDVFYSIALDSTRSACVTGYSDSTDFPAVNAYQSSSSGGFAAVVVKLNPSGGLAWSTFLGDNSYGYGIAVDPSGNAYATGYVDVNGTLPTTPGVSLAAHVNEDAFAAKFSTAGALVYATYLGGAGSDFGESIAVDSAGAAYIAGSTDSAAFTGAPAGGAQTVNKGSQAAFVAKLNPSASALQYFTFLGGSTYEAGSAIAVDANLNAYVAGNTLSTDFPATTPLPPGGLSGVQNGFVAKLNPAGSAFLYATLLGGNRVDTITDLAIDAAGNAYATGYTNSDRFPSVLPIQPGIPGNGTSLFLTSNSGASWSPFDTNIPGAVTGISPDPASASVFVASTEGATYRTTNAGASWTQLSQASSLTISRSPANASTIYGIACGSVFQSTDDGLTWNSRSSVGACPNGMVADPLTASTAYAYDVSSSTGAGPFKTTDGGVTWNLSNAGLPVPSSIGSMVAASNGVLYIDVVNEGVYRSTDHGATWNQLSTGDLTAPINGLAVAPGNPSILYKSAGSTNVLKSTDGGNTWALAAGALPSAPGALAVSPTNPLAVYAAVQNPPTLYLSTDGGTTWSPAGAGLGIAIPNQIVFSPASGATAFVLATVTYSGFVAKLNPIGAGLIYSTYLGGSYDSAGNAIAAGTTGDAFVTGYNDGLFPVTSSALPGGAGTYNGLAVRITDSTAACSYTITPSAQVIFSALQTLTYSVLAPAGCAWTVTSSNPSFAAVVVPASGTGIGLVSVAASANLTGAARTATLTAGGPAATLIQAPSSCSYGVDSAGASLGAAGGPLIINVTAAAGCPWSVVNSYPSAVTLVSGSPGNGNGAVNLAVGPAGTSGAVTFSLLIAGHPYTITQTGPSQPLAVAAPNPPSGSGGSVSFTFTFTDPRGWQDLDVVDILIDNFLDGRRACYLAYSVPSSALYLVDDAGDAGGPFAGSLAPGSSARIQNSQCSVALTSAAGAGNTFTLTLNLSFTASFGGNKILYAAARDQELDNTNWQAMGVWQAPFTPPGTIAVGGPTPARGSAFPGSSTTIAIPITDTKTKGAADIGIVDVLVNSSLDGRQACYIAYAAATNSLLLVDDSGDAGGPFAGSMPVNGQGSIQNSQCLIAGAGSSVQTSGNTLTLTLNITFKSDFAGNQIFYVAGRDQAGLNNTDWQAVATWTVE